MYFIHILNSIREGFNDFYKMHMQCGWGSNLSPWPVEDGHSSGRCLLLGENRQRDELPQFWITSQRLVSRANIHCACWKFLRSFIFHFIFIFKFLFIKLCKNSKCVRVIHAIFHVIFSSYFRSPSFSYSIHNRSPHPKMLLMLPIQ